MEKLLRTFSRNKGLRQMLEKSGSEAEVEVLVPFRRISANRFQGPSGKVYTKSQVKRYYARGGKWN